MEVTRSQSHKVTKSPRHNATRSQDTENKVASRKWNIKGSNVNVSMTHYRFKRYCVREERWALKLPFLVYRHRNASFRFKFALDGLIHPFSYTAGNPNLSTLFTNLDRDIFKKIKMSFYQAVKRYFFSLQPTTTLCTQRIFHGIFSLLVLGSSHLAGSNQWTVMI